MKNVFKFFLLFQNPLVAPYKLLGVSVEVPYGFQIIFFSTRLPIIFITLNVTIAFITHEIRDYYYERVEMAIILSAAILPIGVKLLMQHAVVMYQVFII